MDSTTPTTDRSTGGSDVPRASGIGRVLIAVYAVLALAALGRSATQVLTKFEQAPLAYTLSAFSAVIYVVATVALIMGDRAVRLAWVTITIELVGVLVIGTVSYLVPDSFPDETVWSHFGSGYLYIPLLLPPLGMWWLRSRGRS